MKPEDFRTECWKRLSELVNVRVDELRKLNDQDHSIERTARIRGGISELNKILALAEDASASQAVNPEDLGVGYELPGQ